MKNLTIGSAVLIEDNKICIVSALNSRAILDQNKVEIELPLLSPVRITPDRLEAMGFVLKKEKTKEGGEIPCYQKGFVKMFCQPHEWYVVYMHGEVRLILSINYIHELQLYHELLTKESLSAANLIGAEK